LLKATSGVTFGRLEVNPLAAGHFYPGDLLWAVLRLPEQRWSDSAEVVAEVRGIAQRADVVIAEMDGAQVPELRAVVLKFRSDQADLPAWLLPAPAVRSVMTSL
jgi:hypothetical protein